VSVNKARTSIVIAGRNINSVETLLRRIGYVNTRTFPTPGHRPISIETTVELVPCTSVMFHCASWDDVRFSDINCWGHFWVLAQCWYPTDSQ